ncbi:MAG TPA: rhodanese-like domain-containing protein [Rubrobacter sp.]|nr:rhodanese-like domain-containing protein [Rubrobacter sp.]
MADTLGRFESGTTKKFGGGAGDLARGGVGGEAEPGGGIVLVGVLGEPYYRRSHLPGVISLPLEEIERAPEALPDKDADIVVYCTSPIRSAS